MKRSVPESTAGCSAAKQKWEAKTSEPSELKVSLRSGISGLTKVLSLEDLAGAATARALEILEECPPVGWHSFILAKVLPHLSPKLLLRFLEECGGLEELRKSCGSEEYQEILHALFAANSDWRKVPFHLKAKMKNHLNSTIASIAKLPKFGLAPREEYFRLGLKLRNHYSSAIRFIQNLNNPPEEGIVISKWIASFFYMLTENKHVLISQFDLPTSMEKCLKDRKWIAE